MTATCPARARDELDGKSFHRFLAAAFIVGLGLRLAFALGYWVDKPLTLDEQEYWLLGHNLAAGLGYTYGESTEQDTGRRHFGRAPLYPAFLAAVMTVSRTVCQENEKPGGPALAAVKSAQCLVGSVVIVLAGLMAARAAGRAAGRWAAGLAAVYPPLVWICGYVLSEALYSTLALTSALLLGLVFHEPRTHHIWLAALSGLAAGLAALTRPAMLVFVLLAIVWVAARRRWWLAATFALSVAVVIAPWTARNVPAYGRFVLVASEGGVTFWTGNNPLASGEGDMAANPAVKQAYLEIERRHPELSAEAMEPVYYREALTYIASRPLHWLTVMARKAFYLVVPIGPSYALHSWRYRTLSLISYGLVLPLAIAGFLKLRRLPTAPQALWLLAGSAIIVSLVFFPQERFRIPVIDPTLVICAGAWLAAGCRRRTVAKDKP